MPKFIPGDRIRNNRYPHITHTVTTIGAVTGLYCCQGTSLWFPVLWLEGRYHRIPTPEEVRVYRAGFQDGYKGAWWPYGFTVRIQEAYDHGLADGRAAHKAYMYGYQNGLHDRYNASTEHTPAFIRRAQETGWFAGEKERFRLQQQATKNLRALIRRDLGAPDMPGTVGAWFCDDEESS